MDLLNLIDEIDLIEEPDSEIEWERLKNTYLKLKYINQVIRNNGDVLNDKKYLNFILFSYCLYGNSSFRIFICLFTVQFIIFTAIIIYLKNYISKWIVYH